MIRTGARLTRPMTLGVRAVIVDDASGVFLIRQSYIPGWHLPGGGVEPGETCRQAVEREVREEAGLAIVGEPVLLGLYLNGRRDHVAVYLVRQVEALEQPAADWEIAERGVFQRTALPAGVTGATLARLAEALDGVPRSETW